MEMHWVANWIDVRVHDNKLIDLGKSSNKSTKRSSALTRSVNSVSSLRCEDGHKE